MEVTEVIHSNKLSGFYFKKHDVLKYLKEYSNANVNDIQNAVFDLPSYVFEKNYLVKKDDVEKILKFTPKFFRELECNVVGIIFTRFGQID